MKRSPLPKSTKPLKRTPLVRGTKPIPKKRKGPPRKTTMVRDQPYKNWLIFQRCIACMAIGLDSSPETRDNPLFRVIDPAHTRNGGASLKGDDSSCVPLCRYHHSKFDTFPHGKDVWAKSYGLDMPKISAELYAQFKREPKCQN